MGGSLVIKLTLPYPPTSNHNTMVAHGRRISSPTYRKWRAAAEAVCIEGCLLQFDAPLKGPYWIAYVVDRPDRRRRDIENLPKSISDALQSAGVIEDDSFCMQSICEWSQRAPGKGAAVHVTITAW